MVKTASILGMNDRVISLICVAACSRLTISPLMSAASNSGAASAKAIFIASVPRAITDSGVMTCLPLA
ncbi:hypothetical protein YPPY71_2032 [Yersinia pestis PY-71]|nr:hypothetical protein YPPY71_2032 [Yersinia pestis PY-71]